VLPPNNAFARTVKHRGPRLARHSGGGRPPKTRSLGNNMRMFLSRARRPCCARQDCGRAALTARTRFESRLRAALFCKPNVA